MSELLRWVENDLQLLALSFLDLAYLLRIIWLLRYPASRDRQAPSGSRAKGVLYSWANIAMPWAMESTRQNFFWYLQFVMFHVGIAAAIALSFVIPYAPHLLDRLFLVRGWQALMGTAGVVGGYRLYRRFADPVLRRISTPDDFFSLLLLTIWLLVAVAAAPNRPEQGEGLLLTFFFMTAFFLFYVPFSKILHYLYYPFTRYYFGKSMGHRGVYPLRRGPQPGSVKT